jgi:hypothetical protein
MPRVYVIGRWGSNDREAVRFDGFNSHNGQPLFSPILRLVSSHKPLLIVDREKFRRPVQMVANYASNSLALWQNISR